MSGHSKAATVKNGFQKLWQGGWPEPKTPSMWGARLQGCLSCGVKPQICEYSWAETVTGLALQGKGILGGLLKGSGRSVCSSG